MLVSRLLRKRCIMSSRHICLDASPPPYTGARDYLDTSAFRKTITVLGARVRPEKTRLLLRAPELRNSLLDLPKIRSVISDPSTLDGDRLVLLRMAKESEIPSEAKMFLDQEAKGFIQHTLSLDYNYWTLEECLHAFLPEELRDGAPTGFAMTGHIAHVNLNDEYLPYKHIIGQLILDKNKSARTVVNKLNSIDHQFRFFKMELIAGEPDYIVEHHESDCRFTFDFTKVYWNSRLHTEHERLVSLFKPGQVIVDVFAGVGPFAVPAAAKRGCKVLANDLNPNSAKYLMKNVENNRVTELVRVWCEDGRDFIRRSVGRVYDDDPLPSKFGSGGVQEEEKKDKRKRKRLEQGQERRQLEAEEEVKFVPSVIESSDNTTTTPRNSRRRTISHFVMNLPDSAITFLDAFRGLFNDDDDDDARRDLRGAYQEMPMIHCYCFTREVEFGKAEVDIRKRVIDKIGHAIPEEEIKLHMVRSVAPSKDMYCISFRLPREVAFLKL